MSPYFPSLPRKTLKFKTPNDDVHPQEAGLVSRFFFPLSLVIELLLLGIFLKKRRTKVILTVGPFTDFFPQAGILVNTERAFYEYLGLFWGLIRGQI